MLGESHIRLLDCKGTHHLPRGLGKSRLLKSIFSFMNLLGLPIKLIMDGNGANGSCSSYGKLWDGSTVGKENVACSFLKGLDLQLLLHRRPEPKPREETSQCGS